MPVLISAANAIKVWTQNVKTVVSAGLPQEDIILPLDELNLSGDFIDEAAIDTIRCSASAMLHSIMAKRVL